RRNAAWIGDGLSPELDSWRKTTGLEDVAAHFVARAVRASLNRWEKIKSNECIHSHPGHEFTNSKRTFRFQRRHSAFERRYRIVDAANDQYLVERPQFRIPARKQRRIIGQNAFEHRQGFGVCCRTYSDDRYVVLVLHFCLRHAAACE